MKTMLYGLALWIAIPAFAQQNAHQHAVSPYAGMQARAIKALSEQQTAELRAGKGMAFALTAELNGYPGPAHVLELAQALDLSEEQKRNTQKLLEQMQVEAKALGEWVIAGEYALDGLFSEKTANTASVQEATVNVARLNGQLRATHLKYHLSMLEVLTPAQIVLYRQLRGYQ